nr:protein DETOXIFICATION 14-like [Ipomoea batatas]
MEEELPEREERKWRITGKDFSPRDEEGGLHCCSNGRRRSFPVPPASCVGDDGRPSRPNSRSLASPLPLLSLTSRASVFSTYLIASMMKKFVVVYDISGWLEVSRRFGGRLMERNNITSSVFTLTVYNLSIPEATGSIPADSELDSSAALKLLGRSLFPHIPVRVRSPDPVPSMDSFRVIGQFFRLAVPSAVMLNKSLHYTSQYRMDSELLPKGTRVSNELGAGNPHKARLAACTVTFVAAVETFTVSAALFVCRHFVGRAYSSEKQVVDYIAAMGLLLWDLHCH